MKKEYDFSKGTRGAVVPLPAGKTRVTIRLDTDVLDWFRNQVDEAGGGSYQSLINQTLRDAVNRSREPLEKTLRRVIREELRRTIATRRRTILLLEPKTKLRAVQIAPTRS